MQHTKRCEGALRCYLELLRQREQLVDPNLGSLGEAPVRQGECQKALGKRTEVTRPAPIVLLTQFEY
jgi:hypothetical protein